MGRQRREFRQKRKNRAEERPWNLPIIGSAVDLFGLVRDDTMPAETDLVNGDRATPDRDEREPGGACRSFIGPSARPSARQRLPRSTVCTKQEQRLVSDLKAHLRHRHQILQRVKPLVGPDDSLENVVRTFAEPERSRLLAPNRTDATPGRDLTGAKAGCCGSFPSNRCGCFGDILDLIANGGRKAPVYFAGPGAEMSFGGAILDASA